jgi:hypothetical protein
LVHGFFIGKLPGFTAPTCPKCPRFNAGIHQSSLAQGLARAGKQTMVFFVFVFFVDGIKNSKVYIFDAIIMFVVVISCFLLLPKETSWL